MNTSVSELSSQMKLRQWKDFLKLNVNTSVTDEMPSQMKIYRWKKTSKWEDISKLNDKLKCKYVNAKQTNKQTKQKQKTKQK